MMTYFSEPEARNIKIHHADRILLSDSYLSEREKLWEIQYAKSQKSGTSLWNGEIYTLEKIVQWNDEDIVLKLGTCEYKDVLFRIQSRNKNLPYLLQGPEIQFLTVCCIPITTDNRFVFGVRSNLTVIQEGSLGLIGGTLNKDEKEIHDFEDFFAFMRHEIEEETAIEPQGLNLQLFSLNSFRMKYEFLFTFKLEVHSSDIQQFHRNGEFSSLIAMDLDDVLNTRLPQTDSFRYAKNYLPTLRDRVRSNRR